MEELLAKPCYLYTNVHRCVHLFQDALNDLQGNEVEFIPDEVIMRVYNHVKNSGIDVNALDDNDMWEILRGLGYRTYKDHMVYIFSQNGKKCSSVVSRRN